MRTFGIFAAIAAFSSVVLATPLPEARRGRTSLVERRGAIEVEVEPKVSINVAICINELHDKVVGIVDEASQ